MRANDLLGTMWVRDIATPAGWARTYEVVKIHDNDVEFDNHVRVTYVELFSDYKRVSR